MSGEGGHFAVYPGGQPGRAATAPGREYQELWFKLVRIPWASVVLVPADSGTSVAEVATSLAEVGTQLRETPITAIVASRVDYVSVKTLVELQPRLQTEIAWPQVVDVHAKVVDPKPRKDAEDGNGKVNQAILMPPAGRAIIAIQPVVDQPLGVAIAQAADAVVLCIELGTTRLKAARRTIELIGANRILGAFVVRPR